MYMELLKLTNSRIRDSATYVRKASLKLFAQIIDKYVQNVSIEENNACKFLTLK